MSRLLFPVTDLMFDRQRQLKWISEKNADKKQYVCDIMCVCVSVCKKVSERYRERERKTERERERGAERLDQC